MGNISRTELQLAGGRRLDELPEMICTLMETTDSLLAVCNKKSEAAYLLEHTRSAEYRSFHLSAAMCMQHRRDVLDEVQAALGRKEKVPCIATQVMEAGVDISFGAVLRLAAGMDSIMQAAGRCNRDRESETPRPVYVVNCTDENLGMLRDIRRGKDAMLALTEAFSASSNVLTAACSRPQPFDIITPRYTGIWRQASRMITFRNKNDPVGSDGIE